jgi:hypothetical protein
MRLIPLLAALALGEASFAQRPATVVPSLESGTSAISGVVLDAETRRPIAGCTVTIELLTMFRGATSTTNAEGAFEFNGIGAAEYRIETLCDSHLQACHRGGGTSPPRCDTVTVAVDQRRSNIDFHLIEGATAKGRVVDGDGQPIAGATVRLGMPRFDARFALTKPALTKRDGTFIMTNLPTGGYLMEVDLPQAAGALRPPIVYYPGVLQYAEATFVELAAGRTTEDLTIVAPRLSDNSLTVRLVTVEQSISQTEVSLTRIQPLVTRPVRIDASGTGVITGLTSGQYFLTARGRSGDRLWAAYEHVEFTGGELEVLLYLQPTARIAGRIIGEKGAGIAFDGVRVGATWLEGGVEVNPLDINEAPVSADGTFTLDGLFGTRRLQLIGLGPEWEIRSIVHGRTDVTDAGVTVTADSEAAVVITVGRR